MKEFTNSPLRILVSGWWMAARPWQVEAWAQTELTRRLAEDIGPHRVGIAWPEDAPALDVDGIESFRTSGSSGGWGRLVFEQLGLPRAVAGLRPETVLVPYASAPLASESPVAAVVDAGPAEKAGGLERLRAAAARSGLAGAWRMLQPSDQPALWNGTHNMVKIPPAVSPDFQPTPADDDAALREACGLPQSFVLALGAPLRDVPYLLAAWSWMAPALEERLRLAIGPLGSDANLAAAMAGEAGLADTVIALARLPRESLPAILRGASCLMLGSRPASWQVVRWAVSCGVPVAGPASAPARAILGEAAFLVDAEDARQLGAAGLSLLVDRKDLARRLTQAGLARAADYHQAWGDGSMGAALAKPT